MGLHRLALDVQAARAMAYKKHSLAQLCTYEKVITGNLWRRQFGVLFEARSPVRINLIEKMLLDIRQADSLSTKPTSVPMC